MFLNEESVKGTRLGQAKDILSPFCLEKRLKHGTQNPTREPYAISNETMDAMTALKRNLLKCGMGLGDISGMSTKR